MLVRFAQAHEEGVAARLAAERLERGRVAGHVDAEDAELPEDVRLREGDAPRPEDLHAAIAGVGGELQDLAAREEAADIIVRVLQESPTLRLVHGVDEDDADAMAGDHVEPEADARGQARAVEDGGSGDEGIVDVEDRRGTPEREPVLDAGHHLRLFLEREGREAVLAEFEPHVPRHGEAGPDVPGGGLRVHDLAAAEADLLGRGFTQKFGQFIGIEAIAEPLNGDLLEPCTPQPRVDPGADAIRRGPSPGRDR